MPMFSPSIASYNRRSSHDLRNPSHTPRAHSANAIKPTGITTGGLKTSILHKPIIIQTRPWIWSLTLLAREVNNIIQVMPQTAFCHRLVFPYSWMIFATRRD
jgi:hypothetical protein